MLAEKEIDEINTEIEKKKIKLTQKMKIDTEIEKKKKLTKLTQKLKKKTNKLTQKQKRKIIYEIKTEMDRENRTD